ncbi:MAG: formyltransferase family protein, partial [Eubacterium sp.]
SFMKKICKTNAVEYLSCPRENVFIHIMQYVKDEHVLIVSANNQYIFPTDLVDLENVTIINFHYYLLPDYRGVNIPTWVIYNEEKYTGVTWHYVTQKIDHGKVIAQQKIVLSNKTTAFDIVRQGMELGIQLFASFINPLLKGEKMGYDVQYSENSKLFRKNMLPNDGIMELSDNAHNIQKLLRAYNCQGTNIIPALKVNFEDHLWKVVKYEIHEQQQETDLPEFESLANGLIVNKDGGRIRIVLKKV